MRLPARSARLTPLLASARLLAALALGASALGAAAPSASAQDWQSFHFDGDERRHAIVDDRGGQGSGYSFNLRYDPDDGNRENFCSHCSLAVFAADPGIHLGELELLGVSPDEIRSATDLVSRLQALGSMDAETLATQLEPDLVGEDLAAFVAEVGAGLNAVLAHLSRLETLTALRAGSLDWDGADVSALIDDLGLELDSAFRADFANPNDPRGHNSGTEVYGLSELVRGLAGAGFSSDVQSAVMSSLSSLDGLPGAIEISGDDDDVLAPIAFHGVHTDLTVQNRTYTVQGNDAFLLVYTLVNDTPRVLPFVQVAMIADFDIPPSSYDSETAFEPTSQTVMLYDSDPLLDPELHSWFGLSAAPVGGADGFVFAGYQHDDRLSLSQFASSIEENRFRYFMGDPALVGDQDDASGKSEKQGAITLALPGPMLPGDRRSFAFCFAAGETTASGSAQALMLTTLAACRAMATTLDASCGDDAIQYPEECDGGPDCTSGCEREVCGDGRVNGAEQCDDSNVEAGDGCSPSCLREECGNGVVDPGEECDDANPSNADACLDTCQLARCGDGFETTTCEGPECGACGAYALCFRGEVRLDDGAPGGPFEDLGSAGPVEFLIAFDPVSVDARPRATVVTAGPVHVEMLDGGYLENVFAPGFEGAEGWTFTLDVGPGGTPEMDGPFIEIPEGRDGSPRRIIDFGAGTVSYQSPSGPPDETSVVFGGRSIVLVEAGDLLARSTGQASGRTLGAGAGEPPELCDDGNESNFDACTSQCRPAECGDGYLQPSAGEECDEGPGGTTWCVDCVRQDPQSLCGNGVLEPVTGEECDPALPVPGESCSAACRLEFCGDGIVQSGEECDDGGNGDLDGCTDACVAEFCGDGVVQPGEACDADPRDDGACLSDCTRGVCGDGLVIDGVEGCDDGNLEPGDGCTAECVVEFCGDGIFGPDEECDDGNGVEGDGCAPDCRVEFCGDRRPGPDEECDDGNGVDGDGCDKDCQLEDPEACGDGAVQTGEQCDDGATEDGDGCSATCQLEDPDACGDGAVSPGERCDDGNLEDGDGCSARCTVEECGDGIHQAGEGCDDGNDRLGDGCTPECLAEVAECGNGVQEFGEQCDDGNEDDEDGCDSACRQPELDRVGLRETCGDGTLDGGEQCDDGDREDGDGCDVWCQREATVCGNARLENGESCDDGNEDDGDGCSSSCLFEGREPPVVVPEPPVVGCGACAVGSSRSAPPALALVALLALVRRRRAQG